MNWADLLVDVHQTLHGSKDQKRLSMRNVDRPSNHMLTENIITS